VYVYGLALVVRLRAPYYVRRCGLLLPIQ